MFYNEQFYFLLGATVEYYGLHYCYVCSLGRFITTAGTRPGRFFLWECDEALLQAVFQEICECSHWEQVLQEGSPAADAALVLSPHHCWGCPYSNVFRLRPQKGFVDSLPGDLSTLEGLRLTMLTGEVGRGGAEDTCVVMLWVGITMCLL